MKRCLFFLVLLPAYSLFAQYQYKIELDAPHTENKSYLAALEQYIPDTYSRLVEDRLIQFSSPTNYSVPFIDSISHLAGIPAGSVVKSKGPLVFTEKAGGTDCGTAQQICSNTSLPGNSSGFGVQELNAANSGCLGSEHQSSWYYINVLTGGSMSFRINPSAASDYDFALWGPFTASNAAANCPPLSGPVRCSFAANTGSTGIRAGEPDNSEGAGGDRWVNALNVSSGQVYILMIDNFSNSGVGYTFDFSWGLNLTTAVIGCVPVVLPVEMTGFHGAFSSNANRLSWSTESEENNDYFRVECTTTPAESTSWSLVDVIDGAGNSQSEINYSLNHYTYVRNAINYYRISQVDYNGQTRVYPDMIAVDNRQKSEKIVKVVNLLGQEVSESEKGLVIYVYDDGTTEKRVN